MEGKNGGSGTSVCVTGASGFIGSWLVMRLLERGYFVKATVRDPDNMIKVRHLLDLPNAATHLSLWKADLTEEGSFDAAIQGCAGVLHVASPVEIISPKDPENEVIKPTVDGVLNVMRSCFKAKTVKRLIFTSSIATLVMQQQPPEEYDESFWSDVDLCYAYKMNGWAYSVAKTKAEKSAWEYAEKNGLDLVTIIPPFVLGPFITPSRPFSIEASLALITRNEVLYPLLAQAQAVHVDDVCNAHIYLFEHPQAKGRYICASHYFTILDLAKSLTQKYPERDIPTKFEVADGIMKLSPSSSKKLLDLGFKFKYNSDEYDVGNFVTEAIESSKEKGLMLL